MQLLKYHTLLYLLSRYIPGGTQGVTKHKHCHDIHGLEVLLCGEDGLSG